MEAMLPRVTAAVYKCVLHQNTRKKMVCQPMKMIHAPFMIGAY